jgi:hypothetical protein
MLMCIENKEILTGIDEIGGTHILLKGRIKKA